MSFKGYYNTISEYISDVKLVFDFDKNLSGISYYINHNGSLTKYLSSSHIVRDRQMLKDNPIWMEFQKDFNKKIIVGNENLWFYCHESVWSPSIDAAFLIDVLLNKENIDKSNIETVLDFGCGTGVMGISIAKLNAKIKNVNLIDSNESALFSTFINVIGNRLACSYSISNVLVEGFKCDLGIITPYYFPIIKEFEANHEQAIIYAGIESAKLTNIVANCSALTYFIYSSTTQESYLKNLDFDFEVVDELLVPFTLGDNVSNQSFLNTALKIGVLIINEKSQFKYWHKISIGKIKK